ncbi:MAG: NAD-dependent epimerase [Alphaproteobacteria bacterium]
MKILVTGTAGFIGNHVALKLLQQGHEVIGLDCLTDYYDVNLKEARLERLKAFAGFTEERVDLADAKEITRIFKTREPEKIVNLAAQAGVRHSLKKPQDYIDSNITGFLNILEGCRNFGIKHLVYASSSSVYGAETAMPFSTHQKAVHPVSLYAATKRANELMAHCYSHLFRFPTTGLRFFTVYGPWGRPDMALFLFADAILKDKPIDVFNYGKMKRDFTYIDDIVDGIIRLLDRPAEVNNDWDSDNPDNATSGVAPWRVYNIGNSKPVSLMTYIEVLEKELGKTAQKNMLPIQAGDVPATWADVDDLIRDAEYKPDTSVEVGVANFVKWYRDYYKI